MIVRGGAVPGFRGCDCAACYGDVMTLHEFGKHNESPICSLHFCFHGVAGPERLGVW